jgi:pimeloyl-ACP methyl ester carboxylesterase
MAVTAADGLILRGTLKYPSRDSGASYPLAVLAHQYPATRDSFAPLVEDLLDLGVATLAFDQRGHGHSTETPKGRLLIDAPAEPGLEAFGKAFMSSVSKVGFARIEDDIVRVAGWGTSQNFIVAERLLLFGASVGGPGVLLAAPRLAGTRAVVTFGAAGAQAYGEDGPNRVRTAVERLKAPVLLATSREDPFDAAANGQAWSGRRSHAGTRVVPGAAHAMAIYYDVRDDVLAFVRQALNH